MAEEIGEGRTGAEARLETLFREHYSGVAAYVRRRAEPDLVDDVVAETFLVAWRRLDDVPADARLWLLGVARKTLATQRRSATRRRSLLAKVQTTERPVRTDDAVTESRVSDALAQLPEKDRDAITLIAWDGLTPAEAAAVLGHSATSFRVRLYRAKRRLRRRLDEERAQSSATASRLIASEIALTKGALKE